MAKILVVITLSVCVALSGIQNAQADTNFCKQKISNGNCQGIFVPMGVADTSNDTNGGCPTGWFYYGCIDNFSGNQVCCSQTDTGGKMPCGSCSDSCLPGQTVSTNGWCANNQKCCTGQATTACTNDSTINCHEPNASTKPSSSGQYSYKCVDTAADCTSVGGNSVGVAAETGCLGIGSQICCQIPKCSTGSPVGGTTAPAAAAPAVNYTLTNPLGQTSIAAIMGNVVNTFLGIVGALALLVFVYGGVAWMTARGDAGQVKTAQGAIKNGIIGLAIIAFAYTITSSFLNMLTVQVSGVATPSARSSTEAPTQAQQEQTNLAAQQAAAAAAATAQQQATQPVSCGGGRICEVPQSECQSTACWSSGCAAPQECCPTSFSCPPSP